MTKNLFKKFKGLKKSLIYIKKKFAGKELIIGISLGFVLMSFLMLFANNLGIESEGNQIHAAAEIN
ncbi:hypothetical protein K9M48_02235 [Candidatus Gracilibacteria bacterium]|nr:hypothetical protein [Candidatus Gracilibacteria bacterium]